jgi:DNA-binding protein H-NS
MSLTKFSALLGKAQCFYAVGFIPRFILHTRGPIILNWGLLDSANSLISGIIVAVIRRLLDTELGRNLMSTKKLELESMSVDDLWSLHEKISRILSTRITSEKQELEKRLAVLNRGRNAIGGSDSVGSFDAHDKVRRKYPRVFPKYRNPATPSETWSGRGKQPRWLVAAIKSGRKIDDFRIRDEASAKGRRQRA